MPWRTESAGGWERRGNSSLSGSSGTRPASDPVATCGRRRVALWSSPCPPSRTYSGNPLRSLSPPPGSGLSGPNCPGKRSDEGPIGRDLPAPGDRRRGRGLRRSARHQDSLSEPTFMGPLAVRNDAWVAKHGQRRQAQDLFPQGFPGSNPGPRIPLRLKTPTDEDGRPRVHPREGRRKLPPTNEARTPRRGLLRPGWRG